MRINAVTPMLGVSDIEVSLAFYRDLLGFRVESSFTPAGHAKPSWARLVSGGAEIMLSGHAGAKTTPAAVEAHADAHLYIMTDNLLEVRDRAGRLGGSGWPVRGPWVRFYGIKEIELHDPDGYTLVVGENTDEKPTPE